jgi:uncharacterized protein YodC (DUF2158 family)
MPQKFSEGDKVYAKSNKSIVMVVKHYDYRIPPKSASDTTPFIPIYTTDVVCTWVDKEGVKTDLFPEADLILNEEKETKK